MTGEEFARPVADTIGKGAAVLMAGQSLANQLLEQIEFYR